MKAYRVLTENERCLDRASERERERECVCVCVCVHNREHVVRA